MGYTIRGCAREIDVDRKTIRKYWDMTPEEYVAYLASSAIRKKGMDSYKDEVIVMLTNYPNITSAIVFDQLRERHESFRLSYRSVRLYVASLREELGIPTQTTIRQYQEVAETPPGAQAQVDMGQMPMIDSHGSRIRIYIFAIVMSHSRKKFVCFQAHPFDADDFIMAHDFAFKYYGGRPDEIVYDQDRVMTVSENSGDIIYTEAFEAYRRYAGFKVRLCRGFDPESKGKIENVVKYVKGNYLACRIFHGIAELNSGAVAWLDRTANAKVHETTKLIPDKVFATERKHLKSAPSIEKPPEAKCASIRKTNVVHFKQNRYEVPKGTYFPGRIARIEADYQTDEVVLIDEKTGEVLAKHCLAKGVGKLIKISGEKSYIQASSHKKVKEQLVCLVKDIEGAENYCERLIKAYPRYAKDQLTLMLKCTKSYSAPELTKAFAYCTERDLISANDFRDTLEYFARLTPKASKTLIHIPEKYQGTQPKVRDLSAYQCAPKGGVA